MLRKSPLNVLLRFGKHKTPGFGISRNYYLTVLAAKAPLPALSDIVSPKGDHDTVAGFGVPLSQSATKECLKQPLERGAYALAAPDQKTVLRMMVMSKEEAGFCPQTCVRLARETVLSDEARDRLLSTWNILQLTIESHHPMVHPAVNFLLQIARRVASLTDGLVADPQSRVYKTPDRVLTATTNDHISAEDVTAVHVRAGGEWASLQTLGLCKFMMPEIRIDEVDFGLATVAERVLFHVSQSMLNGLRPTPGSTFIHGESDFIFTPAVLSDASGAEVPCYQLVAPAGSSINDGLQSWANEA